MGIRLEKGIGERNAALLCSWSNQRGSAFQEQWMGDRISYPLCPEKLRALEGVFSIFEGDVFLGVIQRIRREQDNVHIGRFLIDPDRTGRGFGKRALQALIECVFEEEGIGSISLTVYDRNKTARSLYEALGFSIVETLEMPQLRHLMKKYKEK